MNFLRQSTTQTIRFGPCLDKTDGVTEEVSLTFAQADVRLSKDGAAFAQKNAATAPVHDSDGWYSFDINTIDTATVGILKMNVHQPANMLPVWDTFYVIEEAVYDAFFGASSAGIPSIPANWITAAGINADAITAAKIGDNAIATEHIATGAITADSIAANAIGASELATDAIGAAQFAQAAADLAWSTAARTLTASTNFNDISIAQVNTEVDNSMVTYGLDHLITAALPTSWAADVVAGSVFDQIADDGTAVYDRATDSLQAVRDRGDTSWVTGAGGSDRLLMVDTTITGLSTQLVFNLSAGSADNDAYNNCTVVIEDVSTVTQKSIGVVLSYVGATKTVTLREAPSFTIVNTDKIYILAENALKTTVKDRQLDVSAGGEAGLNLDNTAGTISAGMIATDAITAAKIATGAFTADAFAAGAIAPGVLADNVITSSKIASGAIGSVQIAASAITASSLATDTITAAKIATDAITAAKIATGAIAADAFAAGAINAAAIAADAITEAKIADAAFATEHFNTNVGPKLRGNITGTSDSGSTTTMVDNARTEADTDYWKGMAIRFTSGNIDGQTRFITGFTPASDTITFSPAVTNAVVTQGYEIMEHVVDPWTRVLGNTTWSASAIAQITSGVNASKISGLATTTATMRDPEDAANMIVATVDADGNRSVVTVTPPAD